jgi:hypothetical protein
VVRHKPKKHATTPAEPVDPHWRSNRAIKWFEDLLVPEMPSIKLPSGESS